MVRISFALRQEIHHSIPQFLFMYLDMNEFGVILPSKQADYGTVYV